MTGSHLFRVRRGIRPLAAAVAVSAALLGVTACSSSNKGSLGGGGGTDESGSVTLVVPTSQAPWNPAYAKLVKAYEEETGNKVELRPFPNPDVKTQEINDIQSQKHTFDVFQVNGADLGQFNESGLLQPLTDIDPSYEMDSHIYSFGNLARWDADKKSFAESGEVVDLPFSGNLDIFVYRKDIYDKLGLEVPTTWPEVIANSEKIANAKAAKYPMVFRTQGIPGSSANTFDFQALLGAAGGSWYADPGTDWKPTADTEAGVQAATWMRKLAEYGPEAVSTMGQAQVIAELQNGDGAQSFLVAAAASQLEDPANSGQAGKFGYAPLPLAPDGSAAPGTGIWFLGVPAGLPKERAKAALEYITWMTSEKAQSMFAQNGGIPIRDDFSTDGVDPAQKEALAAYDETAKKLPGASTSIWYPFASEMLNITEPGLESIAAGKVTPEAGMKQMQAALEEMVTKLDLPQK
ncbi:MULTISPECIES: ABC transporter substrate-binding protein [unclassified Microbacterium]|uniref:ABC transporter substrate-binding protein n=1 Tax=unclassified Microbacterium TaxID=2609290 RepID=UPI0012FAA705|nr:extracellular solute-binding protein [Microbacterium sp. MAH-37]MVQ43424.1 extracellular solute-binding protein [Microbacterium sp. MAH-37]